MSLIGDIKERAERVLEGEQWWDDNIMVAAEWLLEKVKEYEMRDRHHTGPDDNAPDAPISTIEPTQRLQVTVDSEAQGTAIINILNERAKQDDEWGTLPRIDHDFGKWLQILAEELGEASKADLEVQHQTPQNTEFKDVTWASDVDKELTQAAAVIVAWLEHRATIRAGREVGVNPTA